MLKAERAVKTLLNTMFLMGRGQEVKRNKRIRNIFSRLGVEEGGRLPAGWTWMASRPGADSVAFAYCLFDRNHVYARDIYAPLLGEEPFRRLEQWMLSQGYRAYDIYKTEWADYRLSLSYANPAWGQEPPSAGNEYKIRHTGISVEYDAYTASPVSLGLCIPYGMKPFLERFAQMSPKVQELVLERTKRCDGCRYCVQTDKTGIRPLACVPVEHQGAAHKLCPYFPGYAYRWTSLSNGLVGQMTAFLDFMDGFAQEIGSEKTN